MVPPLSIFPCNHTASQANLHSLHINYRRISVIHICGERTSRDSRSDNREPPPHDTHQIQTAAQGKKNPLTQDNTLRMVCGCLANAMGSTVDPVRPAPNDPTPSIFFSVCAPRSRLRGCMDALLFSAVGTGPCAHPQPRGHSARKGACTDSHDRAAASEKLLFSRQHRSITVCVPVINH